MLFLFFLLVPVWSALEDNEVLQKAKRFGTAEQFESSKGSKHSAAYSAREMAFYLKFLALKSFKSRLYRKKVDLFIEEVQKKNPYISVSDLPKNFNFYKQIQSFQKDEKTTLSKIFKGLSSEFPGAPFEVLKLGGEIKNLKRVFLERLASKYEDHTDKLQLVAATLDRLNALDVLLQSFSFSQFAEAAASHLIPPTVGVSRPDGKDKLLSFHIAELIRKSHPGRFPLHPKQTLAFSGFQNFGISDLFRENDTHESRRKLMEFSQERCLSVARKLLLQGLSAQKVNLFCSDLLKGNEENVFEPVPPDVIRLSQKSGQPENSVDEEGRIHHPSRSRMNLVSLLKASGVDVEHLFLVSASPSKVQQLVENGIQPWILHFSVEPEISESALEQALDSYFSSEEHLGDTPSFSQWLSSVLMSSSAGGDNWAVPHLMLANWLYNRHYPCFAVSATGAFPLWGEYKPSPLPAASVEVVCSLCEESGKTLGLRAMTRLMSELFEDGLGREMALSALFSACVSAVSPSALSLLPEKVTEAEKFFVAAEVGHPVAHSWVTQNGRRQPLSPLDKVRMWNLEFYLGLPLNLLSSFKLDRLTRAAMEKVETRALAEIYQNLNRTRVGWHLKRKALLKPTEAGSIAQAESLFIEMSRALLAEQQQPSAPLGTTQQPMKESLLSSLQELLSELSALVGVEKDFGRSMGRDQEKAQTLIAFAAERGSLLAAAHLLSRNENGR